MNDDCGTYETDQKDDFLPSAKRDAPQILRSVCISKKGAIHTFIWVKLSEYTRGQPQRAYFLADGGTAIVVPLGKLRVTRSFKCSEWRDAVSKPKAHKCLQNVEIKL